MSIGEIADEIHVSYSTAAVRVFRTLHRLRTHMGPGGPP
jgi:DNA-directed RNA polymerase specialized sigma24 family protein